MSLASGTRVGPFEVTAILGAGGMGVVYRARDTKLHRDVALKILPDLFAADADRLARFEREAQVLASLNHPHIGGIHGLEESEGVRALVLELVEGETLSERIARGGEGGPEGPPLRSVGKSAHEGRRGGPLGPPVPVDEALSIAKQIAEALEAAHEHGIIHRDLKPSNIKITPDGVVKVLDFGLAKLTQASGSGPQAPEVTASPTITNQALMTSAGVILGTAAYMAPEQAKGRPADKRSDVWAFGCVLYEMLTGRRPFGGEDISDTLASVLKLDPDWSVLPGDLPSAIRTLLTRCLEKDRRKRVADISTALFVLDEVGRVPRSGSAEDDVGRVPRSGPAGSKEQDPAYMRFTWRRIATLTAGAVAIAAVAGGSVWLALNPTPAPLRVERFALVQTGTSALTINGVDRDLAITPDGTRVIYVGNSGTQLLVRALDQLDPTVLASGSGLRGVFVAPDGQWVGFVENNTSLRKVAITGGPAVTVAQMDGISRGATWAPDDTIIFATFSSTGLQRVPAAGGEVTVLTRPDRARGEIDHLWPEMLPAGRAVLFTVTAVAGGLDAAQVAVLDLNTGMQKTLVRGGSHAHYVPTGHLVYTAGETLRAVAFDLDRLEARGTPVPVLPRLVTTQPGAGDFALAADGTLVYADAPGATFFGARTLVWVDRQGQEQPLAAPSRPYLYPRLSPDGTRVALYAADQQSDIWAWDLARQTLTRLTFDPGVDLVPVWTPDGRRLLFSSERAGAANLYWQPADGTGAAERLSESENQQYPTGVSPDGTQVVFYENHPTTRADLMLLTLDGARPSTLREPQGRPDPGRGTTSSGRGEPGRSSTSEVRPLLQTPFNERGGIVSPDGRWLAYESDTSGRLETYVRPFPNVGDGQWQISTAGGTRPLWARSGQELFYVAPDDALMAVRVDTRGATWSAGTPAKILEGRYFTGLSIGFFSRSYDVSSEGQRFLMIKQAGGDQTAAPPQIVVVQNWFEELKRLVPTN